MKDFTIFKVINIIDKMRCMENYCTNIAEYNYKYNSNPAYCSKHRKPSMVNKQYYTCIIN